MRLIWKPRRHIAAVGHAFILFDFLCRFLLEMRIGELWQEVAEEEAVGGAWELMYSGVIQFTRRMGRPAFIRSIRAGRTIP